MKTSLTETETIEKYLAGKLKTGEAMLFKARLLLDPVLRVKMLLQQKSYTLVTLYGRRKLKNQLDKTHRELFRSPAEKDFQQEMYKLFPNHQ